MNSITSIFLCTAFCLAIACKNNSKAPTTPPTETDSTNNSFMPVTDFIAGDIKKVDSFSAGILLRTNVNGKKDSAYIQVPQFKQMAQQFFVPELDSTAFRQHFTESSLMDETSRLLNFIYTAKETDWPLQKVIVYIKPSLTTDEVNRIYMERSYTSGDTLVQDKLTWKMDEYFYILTIRQPKTGPAVTSIEKVIWDPEHFGDE